MNLLKLVLGRKALVPELDQRISLSPETLISNACLANGSVDDKTCKVGAH